jgi:hypothetical protein
MANQRLGRIRVDLELELDLLILAHAILARPIRVAPL